MRKLRFFITDPLKVKQQITLEQDLSHQIIRVLRLQINDQIYLFNNSGNEYKAIITNIARNAVTVLINDVSDASLESPCKINLGQVLGKGEKMDFIIQKATEMGVHSITPLFSEFAVKKNIAERSVTKLEHWQRIAIAACCQCWRNIVPKINPAQDVFAWIEQNNDPLKLLLSTHVQAKHLLDLNAATSISILVGPEGGFSEDEIAFANANGFQHISLGPRILRTETAALATLAILQAKFGDL